MMSEARTETPFIGVRASRRVRPLDNSTAFSDRRFEERKECV
jgi:hypothetical protein